MKFEILGPTTFQFKLTAMPAKNYQKTHCLVLPDEICLTSSYLGICLGQGTMVTWRCLFAGISLDEKTDLLMFAKGANMW